MPVLHPPPASTHIRPLTPDPSPLSLTETPPGWERFEAPACTPCSHSSPSEGYAKVTCSENLCQHRGLEPGSLGSSQASATRTLGDIASAPLGLGFLVCAVWVATGVALGIEGRDATRCGEGVCGHGVWGRLLLLHHRPPNASPCASRSGPSTSSPGSFSEAPAPPAPPCLQASPGKGAQKGQRALHGACLQSTHPAPRPCQPPVPRQAFSLG